MLHLSIKIDKTTEINKIYQELKHSINWSFYRHVSFFKSVSGQKITRIHVCGSIQSMDTNGWIQSLVDRLPVCPPSPKMGILWTNGKNTSILVNRTTEQNFVQLLIKIPIPTTGGNREVYSRSTYSVWRGFWMIYNRHFITVHFCIF